MIKPKDVFAIVGNLYGVENPVTSIFCVASRKESKACLLVVTRLNVKENKLNINPILF